MKRYINHPKAQKLLCHAPLHEECPKYYRHEGEPRVTPGLCGASGERAQVILMWMMALGVENASYSQRLKVTRVMS